MIYGKTQQELNAEYDDFARRFNLKACEVQQDYLKLSPENRRRFEQEIYEMLQGFSVAAALNALINWGTNR